MATLSHTFTSTEAPGAASATFFLRDGQSADWTAIGTIDAGCQVALQRKQGAAWIDENRQSAGSINASGTIRASGGNQTYRFLADVPTTEPATTLASFAVTLADQVNVLEEVRSPSGTRVFAMTDEGIEAPKVTTDTIAEKTSAAGVTIDSVNLKDGSVILAGGSVQHPAVSVAGSIAEGFGATSSEGCQVAIIEETISFAGNAAMYKELTTQLPANSIVLSVQANVQAALTGGGNTTKVGIGSAADPDLYGKTAALTKNAKIDHLPASLAVIATATTVRVSSNQNDGSEGTTALTVGSVRVRIVYRALVSLTDAA
jgi:hypothetical protein